jgi:type II secretory pathway pseudopilin PulG
MVFTDQIIIFSILAISVVPLVALRQRRLEVERRQAKSLELALKRALRQDALEDEEDETESGWVIAG